MTAAPAQTVSLRARLITAGLEILQDKGLPALTLRACAARAGVSHAAPAHHFAGLPGLLAGITAQGFTQFADTMESMSANAQSPTERLTLICEGYMAFARAQPALFTLMFNTSGEIDKADPELMTASLRAYSILSEACAPFETLTAHSASSEVMIWALVHGLATLEMGDRFVVAACDGPSPDIASLVAALPLRLRS